MMSNDRITKPGARIAETHGATACLTNSDAKTRPA